MNYRIACANILTRVFQQQESLNTASNQYLDQCDSKDRAKVTHYYYSVCRWYYRLEFFYQKLVQKKTDKPLVKAVLFIALYELGIANKADHFVVSESVKAIKHSKYVRLTGFVNAVLRNFCRERDTILAEAEQSLTAKWAHPAWLLKKIQRDHPEHWQAILEANNTQAPMYIRVNTQQVSVDDYKKMLAEANIATESTPIDECLKLISAEPINKLPGFDDGLFYVQDLAGQYAARLLAVAPHHTVLDACAAPGGKTSHLIQLQPELKHITALDKDKDRLALINDNWRRLKLPQDKLTTIATNALEDDWWDGQCFDRILLDAPCSATGVIRRHPDIKLLRHKDDISLQAQIQFDLLSTLWKKLKPGGLLLYSTCSVLHEENITNIKRFISTHHATLKTLPNNQPHWQLLPTVGGHDGFFYTLLEKPVDNH